MAINGVSQFLGAAGTLANIAGKSGIAGSFYGGKGGNLAAMGFGKVLQQAAENLPAAMDKLQERIDKKRSIGSLSDGSGTRTALEMFKSFDVDSDGQLSQDELKAGIESLKTKMLDLAKGDQNGEKFGEMRQVGQMQQMANKMMGQYDNVAKLDGQNTGISTADIKLLAVQDGRPGRISGGDWHHLQRLNPTLSV